MIKKNFFKLLLSTFMLVLLAMPTVARATTVADLQETINRAFKLCAVDSKVYANSCKRAAELNKVKEAAAKKSADQEEYIKKEIPNYTDIRNGVNKSYLIAISDGKISSQGSVNTGSAASGAGDCAGVEISVQVDCGNAKNPIYGYLHGIILFMGAAIGLAVVVTIIVAGIQYSSSAGNPAQITKAKERLTNAVIGLVLYLFLAAILRYLVPQVFS